MENKSANTPVRVGKKVHPSLTPPLESKQAHSDYAQELRGSCHTLTSHACYELNEMDTLRVKHVPTDDPARDWRDLPDELIPWCLPHTADRNGDWAGLFGVSALLELSSPTSAVH